MPYIQNVGKRQWTNVWLESLKKEEGIFENTVGDNISNFLKTINTQIPPFSPKKKKTSGTSDVKTTVPRLRIIKFFKARKKVKI